MTEIASNTLQFFGIDVPSWAPLPILFSSVTAVIIAHKSLTGEPNYIVNKKKVDDEVPTKVQRSEPVDFLGPIGTAFMPFFLIFVTYFLYFSCNKDNLVSLSPWSPDFLNYKVNPFANGISGFIDTVWDFKVFLFYVSWLFYQFFLYLVVPGPIVEGTPLANKQKTRLRYKINAFTCHIITILTFVGLVYYDIIPATYAYDNYVQLITSTALVASILAIYLYVSSILTIRVKGDANPGDENPLHCLSQTGNSGYFTYDFWMGRTLNPRLGFLDLKYVCELRPGLILWSMINWSMAMTQYAKTGSVSASMILVCAFHAYYTFDSHWSERAILTTMDITTDGFGFMLANGDLCWVPMTYTLQTRYMVDYPEYSNLSGYTLIAIILLKCLGMYIFRSSNSQKNLFRTNPTHPDVKDLPFIQTKTGSRLLTAGWWGTSRHINYFGDMIMGLAWCLPTGFHSVIPYFYAVYFTALLVNRQIRDDVKCQHKYGEDWDKYCEKVKYRIIPYVY